MIAVLTKADALKLPAFSQLRHEHGLTLQEARSKAEDLAACMLSGLKGKIESHLEVCKYPPKVYLSTASK